VVIVEGVVEGTVVVVVTVRLGAVEDGSRVVDNSRI
jgi:hypothetical protein